MIDICLLGTGGMMPLPNRYLTSLYMKHNGSAILVDTGEGTQVSIRENKLSLHDIDVICITHFHADHIAGINGLLLSVSGTNRTKPITIIGPIGVEKIVRSLMIIAKDITFSLKFIEIDSDIFQVKHNDIIINCFLVDHKITCYGYNFVLNRPGKFDVEKAKKLDLPCIYWKNLQKGEIVEYNNKIYKPDMVLGKERKGIKVTYTTDTRPCKNIEKFAENADLFICESMYFDDNSLKNIKNKKHMILKEAILIAKKANVKKLWVTHFSPALISPKFELKKCSEKFDNLVLTYDGIREVIEFEE